MILFCGVGSLPEHRDNAQDCGRGKNEDSSHLVTPESCWLAFSESTPVLEDQLFLSDVATSGFLTQGPGTEIRTRANGKDFRLGLHEGSSHLCRGLCRTRAPKPNDFRMPVTPANGKSCWVLREGGTSHLGGNGGGRPLLKAFKINT